jgi:hypothetical protein
MLKQIANIPAFNHFEPHGRWSSVCDGRSFYYHAKHLVCFLLGEQAVEEGSTSSDLAECTPHPQMTRKSWRKMPLP